MSWEGLDRRNFPRVIYPCLVTIKTEQGQVDSLLTHTENIGVGGICVIVKPEIKLFSTVTIEVDLIDAEEHLSAKGRVVWIVRRKAIESHKPMFHDIGIEFNGLTIVDKKRISDLVSHLVKKGARLLKPYA